MKMDGMDAQWIWASLFLNVLHLFADYVEWFSEFIDITPTNGIFFADFSSFNFLKRWV